MILSLIRVASAVAAIIHGGNINTHNISQHLSVGHPEDESKGEPCKH
jgi:hypothetical protein